MFGPFKGMRLNPNEPARLPQLLGTYEVELHPAYDILKTRKFSKVLDVGAAIGYYAVGAALMFPEAEILCWESEEAEYHPQIESLARANGVRDRISVHGFCDLESMKAALSHLQSTLIIMDVEGYEAVLLDPVEVPSLRQATILVEYHDNVLPNCGAELEKRFGDSHEIRKFEPRHRTAEDFPLGGVSDSEFLREAGRLVIIERPTWRAGRHGWLLMEPRK